MLRKILLPLLFFTPTFIFAQALTNPGQLQITKTWSQEPSGYTYPMAIRIPSETMPAEGYPVAILLHGNTGNGFASINQWGNLLTNHILIGPTGYMNSWNIAAELSDAPDVEMVGELVDLLQTFSNVNPNKIRLIGSSNGSALCNRIFVENDDAGIDIICGIVSQLSEAQYHNGDFYYPSGETTGDTLNFNGFDTPKTPLTGRRYLSITNKMDGIIPDTGGYSVVKVNFWDAKEAAYIVAQSQGYTGMPATGTLLSGTSSEFEYAYLSNQVVHLKGDGGHGATSDQLSYIVNYFNTELEVADCDATINHTGTINTGTYQASSQITSNALLATGAAVTYQANVIVLQDGFIANGSTTFHAQIAPCSAAFNQEAELLRSVLEEESLNIRENISTISTNKWEGNSDFNTIKVFPNPVNSFLNVQGEFKEPVDYEVRSVLGKRMMVGKLAAGSGQINLSNLSANIYFLIIEGKTFKLLKTNY